MGIHTNTTVKNDNNKLRTDTFSSFQAMTKKKQIIIPGSFKGHSQAPSMRCSCKVRKKVPRFRPGVGVGVVGGHSIHA